MPERYFKEQLKTATELLDLVEQRFSLDGDDAQYIYYWVLGIERLARCIGMSYYSRRGRKTLIGVLYEERLWLRANVYTTSALTVGDLIDSNGQLKPQRVDDRVIDLEARIAEVARETEVLRTVFEEYCAKEAELVKRGRQVARETITLLY